MSRAPSRLVLRVALEPNVCARDVAGRPRCDHGGASSYGAFQEKADGPAPATRMVLRLGVLLVALLVAACAPAHLSRRVDAADTFDRVQRRESGPVAVEATVLTDAQAKAGFGVDLGAHGVQAAWLSVGNASGATYWLIRNRIDADLYSADEVAHLLRGEVPSRDFQRLRQRLRDESMRVQLGPRTITHGFLFLPRAEGGRFLDVTLAADAWPADEGGAGDVPPEIRLGFAIPLPDGEFDYEQLALVVGREGLAVPDLDETTFRRSLESLPCCATDAEGGRDGDPLNLVFVGSLDEVLVALERAGWSFTHRITLRTIRREIAAAVAGNAYPVAPVSALHAFGRRHDVAMQRARQSIAQRIHLRLWLAPFKESGRDVWVGQVSRDIDVKLTTQSPTLTTHVIDPEVDASREYLLHSLLAEGLVERFGFVRGSRAATADDPATNLTGDPYFSDGMRLVMDVARDPVSMRAVRNRRWERSGAPIASGQSEAAAGNVRPLDEPMQPRQLP